MFGENVYYLGDCEEKGVKMLFGDEVGGLG